MALQVGQAQMAHIMRRGLKDIFGFAALKLIECIGLSSKAELRLSLSQCLFATKRKESVGASSCKLHTNSNSF